MSEKNLHRKMCPSAKISSEKTLPHVHQYVVLNEGLDKAEGRHKTYWNEKKSSQHLCLYADNSDIAGLYFLLLERFFLNKELDSNWLSQQALEPSEIFNSDRLSRSCYHTCNSKVAFLESLQPLSWPTSRSYQHATCWTSARPQQQRIVGPGFQRAC